MVSISSMISLVVLLMATYCYSVPIVTDYDYTTSGYEFTTGKPISERESIGSTLPEEYTTVFSTINQKRESDHGEESAESDELTTPSPSVKSDHQRRSFSGETTPEPFEATSEVSKRSAKHDSDESESHEKTTQHSMMKGVHQRRHSFDEMTSAPFEATPMMHERSADMELFDKFTTERSTINEAFPKRDSSDEVTSSPFEATSMINERSVESETADELTTEQSHAERGLGSDSFTTFESSTQFNNRVGQFHQRESIDMDTTTKFEPTSSGDSFSHATGLLHQHEDEEPLKGKLETEQPETYYRKTETIVPGKITKTEIRQDENQSYVYKGLPVEHQVSSFSEGTTEENESKTDNHH